MKRLFRFCLFTVLFFILVGGAGVAWVGYYFFQGNPIPLWVPGTARRIAENQLRMSVDPPIEAYVDSSNGAINSILAERRSAAEVVIGIDNGVPSHEISPLIYGINWGEDEIVDDMNLAIRRWGGNAVTRYNYQLDVSNRASDWFFENIPNDDSPDPPEKSGMDTYIEFNRSLDVDTIFTLPMIGWSPKDRVRRCGFSVEKYGPQQHTDPHFPDCGNGLYTNGMPIVDNDPTDTSVAIDPDYVAEWVETLVMTHGSAAEGGVRFYGLDNEPMLWHETHRDVHPEPLTYDGLVARSLAYAPEIKAADPTANILGPVLWGWDAYFDSSYDLIYNDLPLVPGEDRRSHDNLPLVAYYLQEMSRYEAENGVRILDYFDLHYYPNQPYVALSNAADDWTRPLRLRSTRSLWDPNYVDESHLREPVRLIPRMHEWVDTYYPGTKLALTEYNFGALDHINGALAQADVLGIFGRERLDMATMWDPPTPGQPGIFAFKMYRNYDGNGSTFGDQSLQTVSSDQDVVSAYGARRSADGAVTIMFVNKAEREVDIYAEFVERVGPSDSVMLYRYSAENLNEIVALEVEIGAQDISLVLPPDSISLVVIAP